MLFASEIAVLMAQSSRSAIREDGFARKRSTQSVSIYNKVFQNMS